MTETLTRRLPFAVGVYRFQVRVAASKAVQQLAPHLSAQELPVILLLAKQQAQDEVDVVRAHGVEAIPRLINRLFDMDMIDSLVPTNPQTNPRLENLHLKFPTCLHLSRAPTHAPRPAHPHTESLT